MHHHAKASITPWIVLDLLLRMCEHHQAYLRSQNISLHITVKSSFCSCPLHIKHQYFWSSCSSTLAIDKVSMSLWKKLGQSRAVCSIYPRISLSNQREQSQFKLQKERQISVETSYAYLLKFLAGWRWTVVTEIETISEQKLSISHTTFPFVYLSCYC